MREREIKRKEVREGGRGEGEGERERERKRERDIVWQIQMKVVLFLLQFLSPLPHTRDMTW